MIANCIENTNLEEMNQEELSSFIAEFKEYMENEKRVKEIMKLRIDNLEIENRVLHNKLDGKEDTEIENNGEGLTEEENEILANAYEKEYAESCYC